MINIIVAEIFWGGIQDQWKNGANAHGTKQDVQTDTPTYGHFSLWGEKYPVEVGVPSLRGGGEQLSVLVSSTVHSHNGSLELILK